MHGRMEDLLKIRDGEPIDAALREQIMADPEMLRELERLRRVKAMLGELPTLKPPQGVWDRIVAETQPVAGRRRLSASMRWMGGAAAAVTAGIALWLAVQGPQAPEQAAQPLMGQLAGQEAARQASPEAGPPRVAADRVATLQSGAAAVRGVSADYAWLVAESARLERMLAELPRQRQLMDAHTAGTIVVLEDHIAWLDEQLSESAVLNVEPQQRQALWSERVEVMNALLQVRYAQAQHTGF